MPRTLLGEDKRKYQALAELIKRYKYGKGLSNEQAGKMIGVSAATWKNYMADPAKIPLEKIRAMQKQLGIPKEELRGLLV